MTLLIAIPTGVKFFNWAGTMWKGQLSLEAPMLYTIGFLVVFLFGGITGIILASPPMDFAVSDSYFVVAHFHYVLAGTVLFEMFAGPVLLVAEDDRQDAEQRDRQDPVLGDVHRLQPDVPRPALVRRPGPGPAHRELPVFPAGRRHHAERHLDGRLLAAALSILMFLWNVYVHHEVRRTVAEEDPWGYASSLEWATSCPPPRRDFYRIPRPHPLQRPAFEARCPHGMAGAASRGVEQAIPPISAASKK